ncbi:MAG: hypothetical protein HY209_04010, partial [Candidatus Omnitrophica bacterium]|nr:hypothetical protein [Candidatus Omnitrophota bacterium]
QTLVSQTNSVLADTKAIPDTIETALKKGVRSKVLNRSTTVSPGDTISVRYQTDSGKTPVITVYDPNNVSLIADKPMTNETSDPGDPSISVYSYDVTFDPAWGKGDFTIISSEPDTRSVDSLTITVTPPLADLASLTATVNNVQAGVASTQSSIDKVATNQIATQSAIGNVQTGVASAQTGIANVQTGVAATQTAINNMQNSIAGLSDMSTKLETFTSNLNTIKDNVSSVKAIVGAATDSSKTDSLYGKLAGIGTSVGAMINKWGKYNVSDIMGSLNNVGTYLGTPGDPPQMGTVFGKITDVQNQTGQIPSIAALADQSYGQIRDLRKEMDLNGKSETAYDMMQKVNTSVAELQKSVDSIPKESSDAQLKEIAAAVTATRKALKQTASNAGLKNAVQDQPSTVTLDGLQKQVTELKALVQSVKKSIEGKQEPVVKMWLEKGNQ